MGGVCGRRKVGITFTKIEKQGAHLERCGYTVETMRMHLLREAFMVAESFQYAVKR
jgi:hypothetical protein